MDLNLDDLLTGPVGGNVRSRAKFQPKAKPRPSKEKNVKVPTGDSKATGNPVTTSTILHDKTLTISPLDVPVLPQHDNYKISASMDISPRSFMAKNVDSMDILHSEVANCQTHGDLQTYFAGSGRETADIFSELESLDDILSENATVDAVSSVKKFQPNVKVNAQPTPRPVITDTEGSVPHAEAPFLHASNANSLEIESSVPTLSSNDFSALKPCSYSATDSSQQFLVSQEPVNISDSRASDYDEDFFINDMLEREEAEPFPEPFPGMQSLDFTPQTPHTAKTEYLDEGSTLATQPDKFSEFSTTRLHDSTLIEPPSELPVTEQFATCLDASVDNADMPSQATDLQALPIIPEKQSSKSRKRKSSTALTSRTRKVHEGNVEDISQWALGDKSVSVTDEENGAGKSSRQLSKKSAAPIICDGMEDGTTKSRDQPAEHFNHSLVDEDDYNDDGDQYRQEAMHRKEASHRKRAPKKARTATQNEKKVQGENSSDGPTTSNKEPSKKKFPHSTRRNRRQVNKDLLETPQENSNLQELKFKADINPQDLRFKDLILLAEANERIRNKSGVTSSESLPNQSDNNFFGQDEPFHHDDLFASTQGVNLDDDEATIQPNSSIHNYHSFMDKVPRGRWSKKDTEDFYKAIRQFGTNFAMIQQLFPDRTRNQVKLKYKKEERQNPSLLHDALTNRSKDHSQFELVIKKLRQAAAEGERDSDRDLQSVGVSDEADVSPETNEDVTKLERKEAFTNEPVGKEEEVHDVVGAAEVTEAYDPWNAPHGNDDNSGGWNENESDFVEEYCGY